MLKVQGIWDIPMYPNIPLFDDLRKYLRRAGCFLRVPKAR